MEKILELTTPAHGQCRLAYVSATQLKLSPYNGRNLNIGGSPEQIPAAGVTVANTGLAASTLHYVYAYMSAGVMTLECSTTGHSTSTTGVEVKTGDATRTLVGMCYTNASSQFQYGLSGPLVLNWFNRREIPGASGTVTGSTSSTASFAEITASAQVPFLTWADECVEIEVIGAVSNGTAGNILHTTSPGLDGAAYGAQSTVTTFTNGVSMTAIARSVSTMAEGRHVASAFGKVGGGTGTWNFDTQLRLRG